MSVNEAAKIADKPKSEQRKTIKLPTKKEAQKEARETGKSVHTRDGYVYDGRTDEELKAAEQKMLQDRGLIEAFREINKLVKIGVTPKKYIDEIADYNETSLSLEEETAIPWLINYIKLRGI